MAPARVCMQRASSALASMLLLASCSVGATAVNAATFAPITGTLVIRAGSKPQQSTPAVIGSATLFDNSFPAGGDVASASLQATILGTSRFNFSAAASSATDVPADPGQTRATASVGFNQTFTTAAVQWVQLTGKVLDPPTDSGVQAAITFGTTGQTPTYTILHTAGADVTRGAVFPSGSYTLVGQIHTTATVPPSHAGAASGFVLIASVADFNANLKVDGPDLATWRTGFGSTSGAFSSGNLDSDGDADGFDFLLWQRQLGATIPTIHATPEPCSAALATIAAAFYCLTCRRAARRAAASPAR